MAASPDENAFVPGEVYSLDLELLDLVLAQGAFASELAVVELGDGSLILGVVPDETSPTADEAERSSQDRTKGVAGGRAGSLAWDHTSLTVTDLDEAIAFYRSAFGYEIVFAEREMSAQIERIVGLPGLRCDLAQLRLPRSTHTLELIAFRWPEGATPRAPIEPGQAHVALRVLDLERAVGSASALGAAQLGTVVQFDEGRSVYMTEPSGTVFELCESATAD